jgi:hypothetical protein
MRTKLISAAALLAVPMLLACSSSKAAAYPIRSAVVARPYVAPVYRAPVYRAPVYRAPVYRAPVYRAPVSYPTYSVPVSAAPNRVLYNANLGVAPYSPNNKILYNPAAVQAVAYRNYLNSTLLGNRYYGPGVLYGGGGGGGGSSCATTGGSGDSSSSGDGSGSGSDGGGSGSGGGD